LPEIMGCATPDSKYTSQNNLRPGFPPALFI